MQAVPTYGYVYRFKLLPGRLGQRCRIVTQPKAGGVRSPTGKLELWVTSAARIVIEFEADGVMCWTERNAIVDAAGIQGRRILARAAKARQVPGLTRGKISFTSADR